MNDLGKLLVGAGIVAGPPLALVLIQPDLGTSLVIGAIGFAFETVGDWQLLTFKRNPANRGRILARGLWHLVERCR